VIELEEDDERRAAAYLKGLVPTAPWEAVVYGWSVLRTSSMEPLIARIREPRPGFDFFWLVGASGEGKSTLLRQIAWKVASEGPDNWRVLWTDRYIRSGPTTLPLAFLETLPNGSRVLLCVDDSEHVNGAERVAGFGRSWEGRDIRVVAIVADRGFAWSRSTLRRALGRGTADATRRHDLRKIDAGEAREVISLLHQRGLLHVSPAQAEAQLLQAAANAGSADTGVSYLLPVLLEITDPKGRGFESILRDLIWSLADRNADDALDLLLSAALTHSAGFPLRLDFAAGIVPPGRRMERSLNDLTAELEDHFEVRLKRHELLTHHPVVADALVRVAAREPELGRTMLRLACEVPQTLKPDLDPEGGLGALFPLVDRVPRHLLEREQPLFSVAAAWLSGWEYLTPKAVQTIGRLARCRLDWLVDELKRSPIDAELVAGLVTLARADHRRLLEVAEEVLAPGVDRPHWLASLDLVSTRLIGWHSWGVLEGVVGEQLADEDARWRSAYLTLLSLGDELAQEIRTLATLSLQLVKMHHAAAGCAVAAYREVGGEPERGNVRRHTKALAAEGKSVPEGGIEHIDDVFRLLVPDLLDHLGALGIFETRVEHVDALEDLLAWATRRYSPNEGILDALARVQRIHGFPSG
jgi:hypothetical protein